MAFKITVQNAQSGAIEFEQQITQSSFTIGRQSEVAVTDLRCSRKHAEVRIVGEDELEVVAIAGTSDLKVGGLKLRQIRAKSIVSFCIGRTQVTIQIFNREASGIEKSDMVTQWPNFFECVPSRDKVKFSAHVVR